VGVVALPHAAGRSIASRTTLRDELGKGDGELTVKGMAGKPVDKYNDREAREGERFTVQFVDSN
jgi:hypothetical protein